MNKLQKISEFVEAVLNKNRDFLCDPDFMVNDWAGGNIDDAFELGIEQGCYDMAFSLKAILEEKETEDDTA